MVEVLISLFLDAFGEGRFTLGRVYRRLLLSVSFYYQAL